MRLNNKPILRPMAIYNGYSMKFWKDRRNKYYDISKKIQENNALSAIELETTTLNHYIQKAVDKKLKEYVYCESKLVEDKRQKLRSLLNNEQESHIEELGRESVENICSYCAKREEKLKKYKEELEIENALNVRQALWREKISRGLLWSKEQEIRLRQMQKEQIEDKKNMQREELKRDMMWHNLMLEELRKKELEELSERQKRAEQMIELRKTYDEQIDNERNDKNLKQKEDWDIENERLKKIFQKLKSASAEELKRNQRRGAAMTAYYEEDKKVRELSKLQEIRQNRRDDDIALKMAQQQIKIESEQRNNMKKRLQVESRIFLENFNKERQTMHAMESETEQLFERCRNESDLNFQKLECVLQRKRKTIKEAVDTKLKEYVYCESKLVEDKRQKLRSLLNNKQESHIEELGRESVENICSYCTKREEKLKEYKEELEIEN